MAKQKKVTGNGAEGIDDYRHKGAKRKNNPPAKIAAEGQIPVLPKIEYAYSPRRPPVLRFDATGKADCLPELLATATRRPLTSDEASILAEALRTQEPWLEWAGKRESQATGFSVDPVALHIHERISAQAIIKVAARQDVQRSLFGDSEQEYLEAVQFYKHDIDWTNRLILGDSLHVMASLAHREDLAGKVQMIYIDPPYGIKYGSNFQPEVVRRDVKDKEADLTREPEMVKAYRDTWHLGVHTYLTYLRDRLMVAKKLLAQSGSIFVQIGEENLHRVREVIDDAFGPSNFVSVITFRTTSSLADTLLGRSADYLIWYAKNIENIKYRRVFRTRTLEDDIGGRYTRIEDSIGSRRFMYDAERVSGESIPHGSRIYRHDNLTSQEASKTGQYPVNFEGHQFTLTQGHWKTNEAGMRRLTAANRLGAPTKNSLAYVRYFDDFPLQTFSNVWTDTQTGAFTEKKRYVVQTNTKVVERCLLMTTDPGDLVLDPTCGSGTTANIAEQWGRRWITIDVNRVAVAISRQRLLTAKYDYFRMRDDERGVIGGFRYKTVPHITLKSIAQNTNLDPLFAKHGALLDQRLGECNLALGRITPDQRRRLEHKLIDKERYEGKRAVTDADRRRWLLPEKGQKWEHWTVPFDTDPDYPQELIDAVTGYRKAWRAKMDEVNACIAANTEQEELVDQPEVVRGITRVSGPFTVEAVLPREANMGDGPIGGQPDEYGPTFSTKAGGDEARNGETSRLKVTV